AAPDAILQHGMEIKPGKDGSKSRKKPDISIEPETGHLYLAMTVIVFCGLPHISEHPGLRAAAMREMKYMKEASAPAAASAPVAASQ
ncbi:hypothetical protein VSR34_25545, partial [Paraburkholderia sp. JHI2823]|uniref:hypothetical protein n=1 Tax=Paraburkholderia sp. JHI2823 TaxID=3112960 RepID=UPI003173EBEF